MNGNFPLVWFIRIQNSQKIGSTLSVGEDVDLHHRPHWGRMMQIRMKLGTHALSNLLPGGIRSFEVCCYWRRGLQKAHCRVTDEANTALSDSELKLTERRLSWEKNPECAAEQEKLLAVLYAQESQIDRGFGDLWMSWHDCKDSATRPEFLKKGSTWGNWLYPPRAEHCSAASMSFWSRLPHALENRITPPPIMWKYSWTLPSPNDGVTRKKLSYKSGDRLLFFSFNLSLPLWWDN